MKHSVIYIPGLGDQNTGGQQRAVKSWKIYGVQGEVFQMLWADDRDFDGKFESLLARIDELMGEGNIVSLVAASAGASAALNAYAARKDQIAGVVLFCGKVNNANNMAPSTTRINKSFGQSLDLLRASLAKLGPEERSRILSAHPVSDTVVPPPDTRIDGAVERTFWLTGHSVGIAYGMTLYAGVAMHFLKRQAKRMR